MSFTLFLAICVLSIDVMIYILFQWVFGEKYRAHGRKLAARKAANIRSANPYLVSARARYPRHTAEREVA